MLSVTPDAICAHALSVAELQRRLSICGGRFPAGSPPVVRHAHFAVKPAVSKTGVDERADNNHREKDADNDRVLHPYLREEVAHCPKFIVALLDKLFRSKRSHALQRLFQRCA